VGIKTGKETKMHLGQRQDDLHGTSAAGAWLLKTVINT
jgi:hypothetical protein